MTPPIKNESNISVADTSSRDEASGEEEYLSSWKLIFCLALGNTIILTAIPKITDQFNPPGGVGWYGSAYILTACPVFPMFGKLYTFYSTKWAYLTISGLGSAGLLLGALNIIAQTVPLNRRPIFTAMMGSIYGIAGVAGPLIGGAFTAHLCWRWYATYAADSAHIKALLVLFGVLFLAFLAVQLPIWFQAIKGATATMSGIMNLPLLLPLIVASIAAGACVNMAGYYTPFMIATPILTSISGGLLSTLKVDSSNAVWIEYQVIYGIGLGLGLQQPMVVVQAALSTADVPTALAFVMFYQTLAGIFVYAEQNCFRDLLREKILSRVPGVDAAKVAGAGATMLRQVVLKDILPTVIEAYNDAITGSFYFLVVIGVAALFAALLIEWLYVKVTSILRRYYF
ncbi:major facilitator superfamily domain-containing protein [Aspergillus bertholletiae]|uniref:Major facilitator superfamily domain-containing protein n=1 Tax=Aspergillus bertholletiae TaxID=1226010 RepID=A0A5N7AYE3_9EURO|nr:major facilitator superfamily domain-containing protein [Aspergillus bertholletiae]